MYAIVKVGGKQYRVEKGDSLLVDRMPADEGATVRLQPLLLAPDGGKDQPVFGGEARAKGKVEATVTGHLRGPKIHVLKFKPKRGYKRRQGHRSELTRLEIGDIELLGGKPTASRKAKARKPEAEEAPPEPKKVQGDKLEEATTTKAPPAEEKPAAGKSGKKPAAPKKEGSDGP